MLIEIQQKQAVASFLQQIDNKFAVILEKGIS